MEEIHKNGIKWVLIFSKIANRYFSFNHEIVLLPGNILYWVEKSVQEQDICENNVLFNNICKLSNLEAKFSSFKVSVNVLMVQRIMDESIRHEVI